MLLLLLILFFCILGVLTGVVTGLLPGLHVNNIVLILLSISGSIISSLDFLFEYGISSDFILILICIYIVSTSICHTFVGIIPSTFLGAPDEDKALSVLPAHSLLLEGKGYDAVSLSALGSYGAILLCFILIYPIRFIIGEPLFFYETLKEIMLFILIAISILMIVTEKSKIKEFGKNGVIPYIGGILFAATVFFISGLFGIIIFGMSVYSPIGLNSSVLFPALAGLFGTPTLITSLLAKPKIPEQNIEEPVLNKKAKKSSILSIATGSISGIIVAIIPGITSAIGTIFSLIVRGESDKRQTIITLSAVNTACAFFVVIVMFIILKARSGAALAVMNLISISQWENPFPPESLAYFLIAILFGGTLSFFLTLKIGKFFAKKFKNIPYLLLIKLTIFMVSILVFIFTGFTGLFIFFIATVIGLLPVLWGVRRSHCMGVLIIPIILFFI
ncbi:MAG: tripartite tricarboxylate transporter permease [Candidatus Thermoplasmatota archaeon]|nr:tripartite tricarboxylate transporter permease [Candidatus Thermoplasmatota archaeon]